MRSLRWHVAAALLTCPRPLAFQGGASLWAWPRSPRTPNSSPKGLLARTCAGPKKAECKAKSWWGMAQLGPPHSLPAVSTASPTPPQPQPGTASQVGCWSLCQGLELELPQESQGASCPAGLRCRQVPCWPWTRALKLSELCQPSAVVQTSATPPAASHAPSQAAS